MKDLMDNEFFLLGIGVLAILTPMINIVLGIALIAFVLLLISGIFRKPKE